MVSQLTLGTSSSVAQPEDSFRKTSGNSRGTRSSLGSQVSSPQQLTCPTTFDIALARVNLVGACRTALNVEGDLVSDGPFLVVAHWSGFPGGAILMGGQAKRFEPKRFVSETGSEQGKPKKLSPFSRLFRGFVRV
jgi:hypothetical protein